jgi:gluconolactonase
MSASDVGPDNKLSNQKLLTDFMIDGGKCGPDGAHCDVGGEFVVFEQCR